MKHKKGAEAKGGEVAQDKECGEEAGRVQASSERGYGWRCLCRWRLKWVMKAVLESCGACFYTTELNNKGGLSTSPAREHTV